ncbi:hypothetical protein MTR_4g113870 [Medicago truncatula]|uniref:TRF2/HOY1 PH-like domain-containing protein n=1 Tax=Medicago truncatula TaxID=3880 RepID=G7JVB1_MEDTR|nr:hypothetical protein MTR_4g113870 [Medicago truncatula]
MVLQHVKHTCNYAWVARQSLFFRETNPQPRKHTMWQSTTDFTNGQANIHRYIYSFYSCPLMC